MNTNARLARPMVIAFVSGKGGVGKTSVAANFAWICSRVAPTVLVDLDFPNQGATGLMAPRAPLEGVDALSALRTGVVRSSELMEIAPNLQFVPAVAWGSPDSGARRLDELLAGDFDRKLDQLLDNLTDGCERDVVVLDCHGGVDSVSAAAFKCSDLTLMITEADSVTFAGTLELLNHYRDCLESGAPLSAVRRRRRFLEPQVKFVVNRLAGKYRYQDLKEICYAAQLNELSRPEEFGRFAHDVSVFCYIPTEDMVAESFGEYPFQVEIAPTSMFGQKIAYLVWGVFRELGEPLESSYLPLAKMAQARHRHKVVRTVISAEEWNTRQIVGGFAWSSTILVATLAATMVGGLLAGVTHVDLLALSERFRALRAVGIGLVAVVGAALLAYYANVFLSLMRYYRSRHRFQRDLFRLLGRPLTAWQRMSLFKLWLLRVGTSMATVFFLIYLLAAAIALPVALARS